MSFSRTIFRILGLCFLGFVSQSCQTPKMTAELTCVPQRQDRSVPCRPFRADVIKMNPELDQIKPLAALDEAGWTVVNNLVVGAPDQNWLGGFTLESFDPRWWFRLPSSIAAPIVSFGNYVMVGLRDGRIMKIDGTSGKMLWEQSLGRFVSRPMVLAGSTIFAVTVDQKLFAVDFESGKRVWVFDGGRPSDLVLQGSAAPVVTSKQVFFGTGNGDLYAIDLKTGQQLWHLPPKFGESRFRDVVGKMIVTDRLLIMARYDGKLVAIDIDDGGRRIVWEKELASITSLGFREGNLYAGFLNGEVQAFEASSGQKLWISASGEAVKTLTIGETALYVGGTNGRISVYNTKDGQLLWHDDLEGALTSSPILHDGKLYFGTGLKVLYAYKIL